MGQLEDKVVVITGGTRGFGLVVARTFVQEGASVVVASRSQRAVDQAVATLTAAGGKAQGIPCDVGTFAQVAALKAYALEMFGKLDVWINNAGIAGPYGPTAHIPLDSFKAVLDTNIYGTYYGSLTAVRHFLSQGHGKVINLLGHGEKGPVAMQNAYASSKGWIRSFTIALAKEYKTEPIGIYAFNPGMMVTDLLTQTDVIAGYEDRLSVFPTVIRMFAKPPEVPAQKMVWLASAATDGRTGLLVRESGALAMLWGALREGARRLLRRPAPDLDIQMRSLPPAILEAENDST